MVQDITGLMEMTLDAEISWNNITMKAINEECKSVLTENTTLLESAINDWFEAIAKWFKEMAMKIKQFIDTKIRELVIKSDVIGKFVGKNRSKITSSESFEVKFPTYKSSLLKDLEVDFVKIELDVDKFDIDKFMKSDNKAKKIIVPSSSDILEKVTGKKLEEQKKEIKKMVETNSFVSSQFSGNGLEEQISICLEFPKVMKEINSSFVKSQHEINRLSASINASKIKKESKEVQSLIKAKLTLSKNKVILINQLQSLYCSEIFKIGLSAYKVCKMATTHSK